MPLTPIQTLASIAVMAVVTFLTRAYRRGQNPSQVEDDFWGMVPPVEEEKGQGAGQKGHLWKGNDLISIFGATALYMVLVQGVFA